MTTEPFARVAATYDTVALVYAARFPGPEPEDASMGSSVRVCRPTGLQPQTLTEPCRTPANVVAYLDTAQGLPDLFRVMFTASLEDLEDLDAADPRT